MRVVCCGASEEGDDQGIVEDSLAFVGGEAGDQDAELRKRERH